MKNKNIDWQQLNLWEKVALLIVLFLDFISIAVSERLDTVAKWFFGFGAVAALVNLVFLTIAGGHTADSTGGLVICCAFMLIGIGIKTMRK